MIANEITDYHTNHFFPVLCEHIDASIEDTFATGLLQNSGAVHQEFNTADVRAVENMIRDKQAYSAIHRATLRTFVLGSLHWSGIYPNASLRMTLSSNLATHTSLQVNQALEGWLVMTIPAKTVDELFNRVKHVAEASHREPGVQKKMFLLRNSRSQSHPQDTCCHGSHRL